MFDVINPATGDIIRQVVPHGEAAIEARLEAARQTYLWWRDQSFEQRGKVLLNVAAILKKNADYHMALMTREMGKPVREARGEINKAVWCCEHYAEHAAGYLADDVLESDAVTSRVQYLPLGTVMGILPWNSPYWLATRVFAPALMAGNTVIIKHDLHVAGCAQALEEAFLEAGAPAGLLQVLLVDNDTAMQVLRDERIQAVSFTGSTRGGREVACVAASEIKPAVLELGGSDPAVVLADADWEKAVDVLTTSRFICCGQSCIAAKRWLIEASIYQPFVEAVCKRLDALKVGDPTQEETDIGPMARAELRDKLHDQVRRSIQAGAKCVMGGEIPKGDGAFYPVTLLTDVPLDAAAFTEETFGPVAALHPVADWDEAIRIANDTPYGLAASVWTTAERGEQLAREFEAGQVAVNGIVKTDPRLPSGGIKCSGYGRELGPHGIHEFVNAQQVWVGE